MGGGARKREAAITGGIVESSPAFLWRPVNEISVGCPNDRPIILSDKTSFFFFLFNSVFNKFL